MPANRVEVLGNEFYPSFVAIEGDISLANPKRFTVGNLEEALLENKNGFCFTPEVVNTLSLGHESGQAFIVESDFTEIPEWAEGRRDSAYGVYFGRLALRLEGVGIDEERVIDVACKHYPLFERDRAVHEFAAMRMFQGEPELRTFEPIGAWVNQKGEPILLTRFEPQVTSLDNLDWSHVTQDPLSDHFNLLEGLQRSAQILARLHMRGYAHGDAQIKNMAIDVADGSVRLIDLTTLELVYDREKGNIHRWQERVFKDLTTLVGSVRRAGLLRGDTPADLQKFVELSLLSVHASMLRHTSASRLMGRIINPVVDQICEDVLLTLE